jgi:hypothetical protein
MTPIMSDSRSGRDPEAVTPTSVCAVRLPREAGVRPQGRSMATIDKAPARALPLLYLGTAHLALGLACLLAALWPRAVAGFFYHAWLIGLVHLVTLGWITFSILGAIYIVGPLALRMAIPARRADYAAYVCAVIGLVGMVAHFWIQEYGGMAWSAATIGVAIGFVTVRIVGAVRRAALPSAVKAHIILASVNFWVAASMGILIASDKVWPFLPGFVMSNVFAHAHLAAIGWAVMMVVGVGYRLLPMTFPSKMPSGRSMYASAILLETGVLGLFVTLLRGSSGAAGFGLTIVAGLAVFAAQVLWMVRHPAPKPAGAPWPDFGVVQAASAGLSLVAAVVLGLTLLVVPTSARTLHIAAAYGVLGLVGFLAQMVVAMEAKLVPMAAWYWAHEGSGYQVAPPSPHAMRARILQTVVFAGWFVGVPALAAGVWRESAPLVGIGAWALFVGVAIAALDNAVVVVSSLRGRGPTAGDVSAGERNRSR